MTAPQVSVVMAVRDDPEGLEIAARSILAQQDVELELVVVDDGSADGTPARLGALAAADSRVRPLVSEGRGLTRALIAGCASARAPLIARQDAGDVSLAHRLRRQVELLGNRPEVVLASCWTLCLGPEGEELQVVTGRRTDTAPAMLDPVLESPSETLGPSSHGSVLFRRSAYESAGGYREPFALAQDWDLWWRLAENGGFAAVPEVLYKRTLSPGSLSFRLGSAQRRFGRLARAAAIARRSGEADEAYLRRAVALSASPPGASAARRSEALGLYFIGSLLRARGDSRAAAYFHRALRMNPLLLRAWFRWAQSRA